MTPEGGWQGTVEEKAPLGEISQTICSRAYTFSSNKIDLGLQPPAPPRSLAASQPWHPGLALLTREILSSRKPSGNFKGSGIQFPSSLAPVFLSLRLLYCRITLHDRSISVLSWAWVTLGGESTVKKNVAGGWDVEPFQNPTPVRHQKRLQLHQQSE